MILLTTLAKLYIIVFILVSIIIHKFRISKWQIIGFFSAFVISLAVVAFNINSSGGGDLSRHFSEMRVIDASGVSFKQFLFSNYQGIGNMKYAQLIAFNVLRYIIIKFTDNYYWLPTICTLIDYGILSYIIIDWAYNNNTRSAGLFIMLLLSFACTPFIFVVSGIRNALAASIAGLGIYLYLYKKKYMILYVVLTFIAATIHPAILLTVPFTLLSRFALGPISFISIFVISFTSQAIARWMSNSSFMYFQIIGRAYYTYTSEDQYRAGRFALYAVLLLIILFLIAYCFQWKAINSKGRNVGSKRLYNFLAIYMMYILGNIGNYDMVLRPAYVLGYFSPMLVSLLLDKKLWTANGGNRRTCAVACLGLTTAVMCLCLYVNYKFLIAYWGWYVGR